MAKRAKKAPDADVTFPPTSMRIDPELLFQVEELVTRNKRAKRPETTKSKVLNAALAEYLKKRG